MHFNATVTGYFTLPHKLFTSTLPLGIYLGDFGSSLFFIVSGASLALTVPAEQSPAQFYKRRARAVYPLFWLAWFVVFSYRFVAHPGSFGGARTVTLVLTLLGLDNFAVAAGWVGTDFACVGEWFLGSILFLYLLFPLLQRGLRKRPWLTWALTPWTPLSWLWLWKKSSRQKFRTKRPKKLLLYKKPSTTLTPTRNNVAAVRYS